MKVIGITGGIASGKSTVAKFIKELGHHVIDADKIGHELLKSEEVKSLVLKEYGPILTSSGEINRKLLAGMVFSDRSKLDKLNSILHPRIVSAILEKINSLRESENENDVFVEAAVLFEMGLDKYTNYIVVTDCPDKLRVKRLMERNHLSKEEAFLRIRSQMSREEFLKRADHVIDTSKSLQHTFKQVSELLQLKPWSDKI